MSVSSAGGDDTAFHGAKIALFIGAKLITILRDEDRDIPWPGHWDMPGGGREGDETGLACVLRETQEELGLIIPATTPNWGRIYWKRGVAFWFFVAHLPASAEKDIVFGAEGQRWELIDPMSYLKHPKAIPQFQSRLADYLAGAS